MKQLVPRSPRLPVIPFCLGIPLAPQRSTHTGGLHERLWEATLGLDGWIARNGWAGWDPYDIRGTPAMLRLERSPSNIARLVRGGLYQLERRAPLMARKLTGVKPQVNAKGMGLFASSYLRLWKLTGDGRFLGRAEECLSWLKQNPAKGYPGISWGYPFDWQSRIFIPRGTPSAVVTVHAADAFWDDYVLRQRPESFRVCEQAAQFLAEGLNHDDVGQGATCLSYTPLDQMHVHNANLFSAEFLIRIGRATNRREWVDLGLAAARYALKEQREDGSIDYYGRDQAGKLRGYNDHYHVGFEIRCLDAIGSLTGDEAFTRAADHYYSYYVTHYLASNGHPKLTPAASYPVNIHACAEALLVNAQMSTRRSEGKALLERVTEWTLEHMRTEEGWFGWLLLGPPRRTRLVEIPMLRWGQAWMLRGLVAAWESLKPRA